MDGYEFVRQLRADSRVGNTPVIFHTAHYHELAARQLAQTLRVARVLAKPSNSAEIREAVQQALADMPTPDTDAITEEFDREHLRLLTNKLSEHADELRAANARLAALTELNVQLASERDPRVLLERVCQEARNLLGSKYAVLAVVEIDKREQAQAKIEHLNRVHAMLSGINSLIVRVNSREELFKEACRLAVEHGRPGAVAMSFHPSQSCTT